jgi:hypothetical protein
MTIEEFKSSFEGKEPPVCLSIELKSMWYAANDNWEKAHELIQHEPGTDCALIHAHLHRVEGDSWNSDYWYSKAGTRRSELSTEDEYHEILKIFF